MDQELLLPTYAQAPFQPVRGQGSRLWVENGRDYIDLAGGVAVSSLGHSHPELLRVLDSQAGRFWHLSNFYASEPVLRLAQALTEATFADRVFFANSGTEAIEAAVKIARRHAWQRGEAERQNLLCFSGAFHGRSTLAIALGDKDSHRQGFGPLPEGIERSAYNDVAALDAAVHPGLAAVLVEPVQGEAGVITASDKFLRRLRQLCDERGCLLIYDEVQSGNARTGPLFAYMHSGVQPDILATAKGLAAGLPLGAVLTTEAIASCMTAGSHGSTFGGNPLSCAVAVRTLQLLQSAPVRQNIATRSEQLYAGLQRIGGNSKELFAGIRVCGLWSGCTLAEPWAGRVGELLSACWDAGVLALPGGEGDVLRLAPALNITADELATGLWRLQSACASFVADEN